MSPSTMQPGNFNFLPKQSYCPHRNLLVSRQLRIQAQLENSLKMSCAVFSAGTPWFQTGAIPELQCGGKTGRDVTGSEASRATQTISG